MKALLLLGMVFFLLRYGDAQQTTPAPTTTTSLTPAMSSASVASFFSALATTAPQQPGNGQPAGDAGSSSTSADGDSNAGASGSDSESITLSQGAIIAIIVIAVAVIVFGVTSAVLFYLAKKRSWEVRKSIRRSAKKVATALTPRRTTFPKDVRRSSRGLQRIDEVPPTPRRGSNDVEKANVKLAAFEMSEPPQKSKWERRFGR